MLAFHELGLFLAIHTISPENVIVFVGQKPGRFEHTLATSTFSGLGGALVRPQLQRLALLGCNEPIGSLLYLKLPFLQIKN